PPDAILTPAINGPGGGFWNDWMQTAVEGRSGGKYERSTAAKQLYIISVYALLRRVSGAQRHSARNAREGERSGFENRRRRAADRWSGEGGGSIARVRCATKGQGLAEHASDRRSRFSRPCRRVRSPC